jgi:hypothetical protein
LWFSVFTLLFDPVQLLPLAFKLGLISVNLPLLIRLFYLLTLELVANQRAGTETKRAADGSARAGMTDRCSDDTADGCTSKSADTGAFFTGG